MVQAQCVRRGRGQCRSCHASELGQHLIQLSTTMALLEEWVEGQQESDMEAPQISTLRQDSSPPPPVTTPAQSRVKLKLSAAEPSAKAADSASIASKHSEEGEDEVDDEPEDQEDQLIDDDDEHPGPTKPKFPAKPRKARKSEKPKPSEPTNTPITWIQSTSIAEPPEQTPPVDAQLDPGSVTGQKRKATKKLAGAPKAKKSKYVDLKFIL